MFCFIFQGLSVTVEQAHGLPNNSFVNVFVHVSSGAEKALIKHRDFNSYQKFPKWIDPPVVSRFTNLDRQFFMW